MATRNSQDRHQRQERAFFNLSAKRPHSRPSVPLPGTRRRGPLAVHRAPGRRLFKSVHSRFSRQFRLSGPGFPSSVQAPCPRSAQALCPARRPTRVCGPENYLCVNSVAAWGLRACARRWLGARLRVAADGHARLVALARHAGVPRRQNLVRVALACQPPRQRLRAERPADAERWAAQTVMVNATRDGEAGRSV